MIIGLAIIFAIVVLSMGFDYFCSKVPEDVIPCATNHEVYHEYLTWTQEAMQNYILSNIF